MAYDEHLADRLRALLAGEGAVTERRMFGGLALLLDGHLVVAASRTGGLMARVDPADTDAALQRAHAEPMVMRDRPVDGWVRVAPEGVRTTRQLSSWVGRSLAYVRTLPPT